MSVDGLIDGTIDGIDGTIDGDCAAEIDDFGRRRDVSGLLCGLWALLRTYF